MKSLLLFLLSTSAWASIPQHWTPWPPNGMNYLDASACPQPCYPLVENGVKLNTDEIILAEVEVDDPEKPIHQDEKLTVCTSEKACRDAAEPVCLDEPQPEEGARCQNEKRYCDGLEGFSPHIVPPKEGLPGVVVCRKLLGYQKRIEKKLLPDPAKIAAKEAARAAAEQAKAQAKAESDARKARLRSQVANAATVAQLRALVKDLVDELVKE